MTDFENTEHVTCEFKIDRDDKCQNRPMYWFEINSRVTFRCDYHKFNFASQILSKGKIENITAEELNKIQKQVNKRLEKQGIPKAKIESYNIDTTKLAWEFRKMTPKRFEKLLKKTPSHLRKQFEDAYYSVNQYQQKEPIEKTILRRIMLTNSTSEIASLTTLLDIRIDENKDNEMEKEILKEGILAVCQFPPEEIARILKLKMTLGEFFKIIKVSVQDNVADRNPESYQAVKDAMDKCPTCIEIMDRTKFKSKAESKTILWEHCKNDHSEISQYLTVSGAEIDSFIGKDGKEEKITPITKLFEKMKSNALPLNYSEEEAEKIYRKHIDIYCEKCSDDKGMAEEIRLKQYADMCEKELLTTFDVNDFLDNMKLGTEIMDKYELPLFPITYSFHKAILREIERIGDAEKFIPLYTKMMEIDFLSGVKPQEKVDRLKEFTDKEYPDLQAVFDLQGKDDIHKTIMKIVNAKLSIIERRRFLENFLSNSSDKFTKLPDEERKTMVDDLMEGFKTVAEAKPKSDKNSDPTPRKQYCSYAEFQNFLKEKDIKNYTDWANYVRFHSLPENIPPHPDGYYRRRGEWSGWTRAVGKKRKEPLTRDRLDEMLDHILENWNSFVYLKDAVVYYWFDTMGLFGVKDPLKRAFFQNFIEWRDTEDGMNALKSWLIEKDFTKSHFGFTLTDRVNETEEQYRSRAYTSSRVDNVTLFRTKTRTVTDIFEDSRTFDPVDYEKNPELFELFVNIINSELWVSYFDNPDQVLHEKMNGELFHDTVVEKFRKELKKVDALDYKQGQYRGKHKPTILQRYGVYRSLEKLGLLNMYGTGLGKTKVATMLAKAMEARKVFWIAPKSVLKQTDDMILEDYPNSRTTNIINDHDNTAIPQSFLDKVSSKNMTKFHFINYDRFNQDRLADPLLEQLKDQKVDLLVLDEAQKVKNRKDDNNVNEREKNGSKTRQSIIKLIKQFRKVNPNLKIIMLSATPVVNNVREAISIWEMLTDSTLAISGQTNIKNAMKVYIEFLPYSVRYEPKYDIDVVQTPIICEGYLPDSMSDETKSELSFLEIEQYLTEARIPKMVERAKQIFKDDPEARILIYSDMKTGIVDKIGEAFTDHPEFKVGYFTGDNKAGMIEDLGTVDGRRKYRNPFIKGDVNILIATRAIAVGIDGIQKVCNHIFFNGLVWTWADFEQIRGRLVRTGHFSKKVYVDLFFATLDGYAYDLNMKYKRIIRKKGLGEIIRDGRLPKEVSTGVTDKEKEEAIKNMIKNRRSGFPTREELERKHAEIATSQMTKDIENLSEDFPTEELFGVFRDE